MPGNTLKISLLDPSGNDEIEHILPAKNAVCSRCEGFGSHLSPSIGSYAYSAEEFAEAFPDDESREAYFQRGGMYDVACEVCKGAKVVLIPDVLACKSAGLLPVLKAWCKQESDRLREEAEDRRTQRAEDGFRHD
jgi:hypothetical protein